MISYIKVLISLLWCGHLSLLHFAFNCRRNLFSCFSGFISLLLFATYYWELTSYTLLLSMRPKFWCLGCAGPGIRMLNEAIKYMHEHPKLNPLISVSDSARPFTKIQFPHFVPNLHSSLAF